MRLPTNYFMFGFFIVFVIISCIFPFSFSLAAVIWQENFDEITDGWNCNGLLPEGWESVSSCQNDSYNNAHHYSMEVTSLGARSGNSMKVYRRYGFPANRDTFSEANIHAGATRDVYIRYYMKLPVGLAVSNMEYIKQFVIKTNAGTWVYLNFNADDGTWASQARYQILANSTTWYTLLKNSELIALQDGKWHCYEIRLQLNTTGSRNGILQFWVDGVPHNVCDWDGSNCTILGKTNIDWGASTSDFFSDYSFGIGNRGSATTFQTAWQAFEFDDITISTTYVGPDGSGNNQPSAPTGLKVMD